MHQLSMKQFAVFSELMSSDKTTTDLRLALDQKQLSMRSAAFSNMMSRLIEDGFVSSKDDDTPNQRGVPRRVFKLLNLGKEAWKESADFYQEQVFTAGYYINANGEIVIRRGKR